MPDPSVSEALKEAYAVAPDDEVIIHTLELRHPNFVDEEGNPDSIWVTTNEEDIAATLEVGAPVKGGETVTFLSFPFQFRLAPIENSAAQELELAIDNVDRRIIQNLDLAMASATKIEMCYRPYLASDLSEPQMDPAPTYTLSQAKADGLTVRGRARVGINLNVKFPREVYTAAKFPALIGQ
jgi:hypothetical protein